MSDGPDRLRGGYNPFSDERDRGQVAKGAFHWNGPMPVGLALEVTCQVARALVAAEAQGLVHRDLKPANLMVVEGPEFTVKVIDFGLAKAVAMAASEANFTQGGFIGTPAFASPEQCAGRSVDVRSDLYSLGVTLWQMLSGQALFRGSPAQVMHQHLHGTLPLDQLEGVPQPACLLITILLEKNPGRRFQSATQFLRATSTVMAAIASGRTVT